MAVNVLSTEATANPALLATAADTEAAFSIVCLSPQAWDTALPTNRQQIMRRFARRGHQVLYVETGAFLGRHLARVARRSLWRQLFAREEVAPGIGVRKGLNVVPWGHTRRPANAINCRLTALAVRRLARTLPKPVVLWIYDPCAAPMIGRCGEQLAVYDCVDDHAALVRDDARKRAFVAASDAVAARRARIVSTTTATLYERHRRLNGNTHLVRNCGDYGHFLPAADRSFAAPEVQGLPRPVIGFVGNFLPGKVDFGLLEATASRRPEWTLLMVGPAQPGTEADLERLTRLRNVRWRGPKPYEEVPRYVAAFDVGLCPYVWNDWMRSGFPLKLYEYLAAGKPVVASGNPDLVGMEPDVLVARGAEAFVAAIETALATRSEADRERRMRIASRNTWETRTQQLHDLVAAAIG